MFVLFHPWAENAQGWGTQKSWVGGVRFRDVFLNFGQSLGNPEGVDSSCSSTPDVARRNNSTLKRRIPRTSRRISTVRKTAIGVLPMRTMEAHVLIRILKIVQAVCLATGIASVAQSPFIGQWKLDSSRSRTPDEMKVQSVGGNKYIFNFGGGAETIVADGTDQPGLYGTLLSAKAEAPDTWIVVRKKDGRIMLRGTWKLSSDGNTLTDYYREFAQDGSTISLDYVYQRVGGGSGFAADWQSIKETNNSPVSMEVKAFEGEGLSFVNPGEKQTKNVKFDGKDYPMEGANGQGASASAQRVDEHNVVITDKYKEKAYATEDVGLSADAKTLTMTVHFTGRDKPNVLVFDRQ
jgi:hypothetical protein